MRFVENLRDVEQKGVNTIRRSVERVREEWADVERRLRQRMRIYPHKQHATQALSHTGPAISDDEMPEPSRQAVISGGQKPIISSHGRDLKDD